MEVGKQTGKHTNRLRFSRGQLIDTEGLCGPWVNFGRGVYKMTVDPSVRDFPTSVVATIHLEHISPSPSHLRFHASPFAASTVTLDQS